MTVVMTTDDERAIKTVIFEYAWALDTKDWAAFGACFAEVCDLSYGHGDPSLPHPHDGGATATFSSRDEFVAYIARTHQAIISAHMMGASVVALESVGVATARTYGRLVLAPRDGSGGRYESLGVYADVLRQQDGVWRFTARRYTRLWSDGDGDILRGAGG